MSATQPSTHQAAGAPATKSISQQSPKIRDMSLPSGQAGLVGQTRRGGRRPTVTALFQLAGIM
jgi:hypothetical protein